VTPASGSRFTLIWESPATAGLGRLRAADPATAKDVRGRRRPGLRPRPEASSPLGASGLRRLRIGSARVLYKVDDVNVAVQILVVCQAH
jgi:mRNA-degrading endonuclease RelE of RelBE toxin-antitoxin system